MNVKELKDQWKNREIDDGDMVEITGTVVEFWERKEGEGWTFDPCKFGSAQEWIRLSFKDAPSDGTLQQLQGQERTFVAQVGSYNKKPNLTVLNTYEQLFGPQATVDINADMEPAPQAPQAAAPQAQATATTAIADLCALIADLQGRVYRNLANDPSFENEQLSASDVLAEAGNSARSIFIMLDRAGKLQQAINEMEIPF
jgi:hypothetical protein